MDFFPPSEAEQTPETLLPTEEEVAVEAEKTQKYRLALAERYAEFTKKSVEETLQHVENNDSGTLFQDSVTADTVMEEARVNNAPASDVITTFNNYQEYLKTKYAAGDSVDLVEQIMVDPLKDPKKNDEITQAILHDAFQRNAPSNTIVNNGLSFAGMLAYEMSWGTAQNILGATGLSIPGYIEGRAKEGYEMAEAIRLEPNIEKKKILADEYAKKGLAQGLFNNNSLLYWQYYQNIEDKGFAQREGFWGTIDVASLGAGKIAKGIKVAAEASGLTKKLYVAGDALEATEAVAGKAAANSVMDKALANPVTSINMPKHSAPSTSKAASNNLGPTIKPVLSSEVVNNYKTIVEDTYKGMYTPEQIKGAVDRYAETLNKSTSYHVMDIKENNLGLDNFSVKVTLGNEAGLPFKDWANAQKFNKNLGGTVEPYGLDKTGTKPEGYVITFDRNLSLKGMATPTDLATLRSYLFDQIYSPEVTSSVRLNNMLKRGQDKIGSIQNQIMVEHNKIMKKVKGEDWKGVELVINKLVNENPLNGEWYDLATFRDVFFQQTGKQATQEIEDAYVSSWKIADTARLLAADQTLKRFSSSKMGQFVGSFDGISNYRMNRLASGALPQLDKYPQKYVYDFKTGKNITKEEFFKRAKKEKLDLFQLVDPEKAPIVNGSPVLYATGTLKSSRPLIHSDVLPKLPGGFRDTSNVKGFLVSTRTTTDSSGNILNLIPRLVFVGRTDKELADAGRELNTLLKGYRELGAGTISKTDFENLVKNNNGFNPNIEDFDSFETFLKNSDMGDHDVISVTKEMNLPETGIGYFENYRVGKFQTFEDVYRMGELNNKITYGYGAGKFKHIDVGVAMERDFAKGINYMAEREWSYNAIEGFIKAAKDNKLITNLRDLENKSLVEQLNAMNIVKSKAGEKLETERRVIQNRLHETNVFAQKWDRRMASIGEFIFDKTKGKVDIIDRTSIQPDVVLRSAAFDAKLGMFNPDQYLVQASSAISIMAIDPINGLKAAATYLPIRTLLRNSSPEMVETVYKRVKPFIGMSRDEFKEFVDYAKKSGFLEVNQNISEIGASYGITRGAINTVREKGRFFFKEGETVSRIMASNVAYRQFRKTYPTLDITTDAGFRVMDEFMTSRVHAMTMNMTRASAAGWQKGWLSIPTQWLGYQAKLMEALFFGRGLTGAERARLASAQILFFGAAGVPGASYIVNAFVDQTAEGIDKDAYTFLRYGLLDYTLSNIIGEETALSSRLGTGGGLDTLIEDLQEKSFVETIFGPSGGIVSDVTSTSIQLLKGLFTQDISITQYDLTKVLRNVSSANKGVQALYLMQTGEYINKQGMAVAEGMNPWNALWNTLGIPLQEVTMYYDMRDKLKYEKDMIFWMADRKRELMKIMRQNIEDGDMVSAEAVEAEMRSLTAPLTRDQFIQVSRLSNDSRLTVAETLLKKARSSANQGMTSQYQKIVDKEGQ